KPDRNWEGRPRVALVDCRTHIRFFRVTGLARHKRCSAVAAHRKKSRCPQTRALAPGDLADYARLKNASCSRNLVRPRCARAKSHSPAPDDVPSTRTSRHICECGDESEPARARASRRENSILPENRRSSSVLPSSAGGGGRG